jgi:hypothetical protein
MKKLKHLINILKSKSDHHPNYCLFLGAGASVTSHVSPASTMIKAWRSIYKDIHNEKELINSFWYNKPEEYSVLFETLYDQPSQRREYIEGCLSEASPSWGYIYLVNLINHNVFNTIFTTNFDDLINESCYTFSRKLRPLVAAHDSSIKSVRITSDRPKIIKLHGDFLFDSIKNTVRELESLEENMKNKFSQYASEFGLIVMGYAGNDRSIMDTLRDLLNHESNFKHGIYWCVRKGFDLSKAPSDLQNLVRFSNFYLVEIEGFDQALAEIHQALGLKLQPEVSDPYRALANKIDEVFSDNEHYVIKADYNALSNSVSELEKSLRMYDCMSIIEEKLQEIIAENESLNPVINELLSLMKSGAGKDEFSALSPKVTLLEGKFSKGDYKEVLGLTITELKNNPTPRLITLALHAMAKTENKDCFAHIKESINKLASLKRKELDGFLNASVIIAGKEFYREANAILLIILKFLGSDKKTSTFIYSILNFMLNSRLYNKKNKTELPLPKVITDGMDIALNLASDNEDWRLIFGFGVINERDELAIHALEKMSKAEVKDFHLATSESMPITLLFTKKVSEKITKIVQID